MKKLRNTIGAMAVLAVGIEGAQASADQSQETVQTGVYYALTADAARALDINFELLFSPYLEPDQFATSVSHIRFELQACMAASIFPPLLSIWR